ncbi:MAG: hypothetical protein QOE61_3050 [Micromonosporaceae bacterium]|jgi:hypothetical protein|uniref:hypothetical protein n=1 Tax=Mycobacterium sp. TaxID=1785 RepID=UPI0028B785AF|nr:hypothetical protein [Mycobacterium sp.]MDT5026624.1 hypothetical protein [Micromonosporaceae bacterium]MDT5119276.1 hypothetical protein [Mycobacterium sp.]
MAETQEIQLSEVHYILLVDIEQGNVFDQFLISAGEKVFLAIPGEPPADVSKLVWDLEHLGWCWRPADDDRWQLTDAGRLALEGSGL